VTEKSPIWDPVFIVSVDEANEYFRPRRTFSILSKFPSVENPAQRAPPRQDQRPRPDGRGARRTPRLQTVGRQKSRCLQDPRPRGSVGQSDAAHRVQSSRPASHRRRAVVMASVASLRRRNEPDLPVTSKHRRLSRRPAAALWRHNPASWSRPGSVAGKRRRRRRWGGRSSSRWGRVREQPLLLRGGRRDLYDDARPLRAACRSVATARCAWRNRRRNALQCRRFRQVTTICACLRMKPQS